MSRAAAYEVKGWCPGVLTPMESGDGLLVRVKPWASAITRAQATALADLAERFGSGQIDLTRRANLQIRGVREEGLNELRAALDGLGLLDRDAAGERVRSLMVGPAANDTVRSLADALTRALLAEPRLAALPPKFGWLVDGPGPLSIVGEPSTLALFVTAHGVALRQRGTWHGIASHEQAVKAAIGLALGERPLLAAMQEIPVPGRRRLGAVGELFGVGIAFGSLDAAQLRRLAATPAVRELRLSPWRALYLDAPAGDLAGGIVDEADPLLRVEACPGAPACASSSVDTRAAARRLAARGFSGSVHVSGCAKGCARSAPANLTLIGEGGCFGVVQDGTTRDAVERYIVPEAL